MPSTNEITYITIILDMFDELKTASIDKYIDIIINTIIRIKDKYNEPSKNYSNLLIFLIVLFIVFGYIIFLYNPYNILYYFNLPLTILYVLILFYLIIYYFIIFESERSNKIINVKYETKTFTETYLKLIGFVIVLFIGLLIVYFILKKTVVLSLSVSMFLTIFIFVILLAIIASVFKISNNEKLSNNPIIELIKNVIFYIPCLLIDLITFIIQDYKDTPNVTKILFVFLIMVIIIYLLINTVSFNKHTYGIELINEAQPLNTTIISLNKVKLQQKIIENKSFFEKQLYKIQIKKNINTNMNNMYDISANIDFVNKGIPVIPVPSYADRLSRPLYKNKEGFTSILSEETIPVHLTIDEYDKYILQQLLWENPSITEDIKKQEQKNKDVNKYIKKLIDAQKKVMSYYEKVMLYFANFFNKDFTKNFINDVTKNNYHYSFSFWVYLNPLPTTKNKKDLIYKYGNRPSMYFNHNTKELTLEYVQSNNINPITLYRSNGILYQKWNNIVINNNYGEIDLFINGNLMGNYKNIVNYKIDQNETLQIGDKNNNDLGGIGYFYYYENPLKLNEILNLYKRQPSF